MKRIAILLISVVVMTFFFACQQKEESKMLDVTITKTNLPEIISSIKTENIMSSEDILMLNNALNRIGANNPDTLIGLTPRKIMEIQENFIKENQFEMINVTATRIAMNMNFDIKFLGLRPLLDSVTKAQGNTLFYQFTNNSDKPIKKIEGLLQFYNPQNQLIKQFPIETTEILQPKMVLRFYKNFAHNENEPRDTIVRNHFTELIVKWQPTLLEFSDGTKIEVNLNK
ncbi:hypothetical protein D9V86_06225 [Bacteroidetes/Chlorobi group bacterium ChocPot_Mid]|nr:MAG: hypothetical protein D9V86_06225 [Bacteroidetes/Chlorobi group bacterium ChocPot_Mid]